MNITVERVGAAIGLGTLIWGVFAARRTWTNDIAVRRAEYIRGYTKDFYEAQALPMLFLEMDHGRFRFGREVLGTSVETDLAHLLDFFNIVGMAVEQKIVDLEDLRRTTIGYAALVAWRDEGVQAFLKVVDDDDAAQEIPMHAFGYFRQLGQRLQS
jgi:hypothetical protein